MFYNCKDTAVFSYNNHMALLYFKYFFRIYMHIIKASKDLSNYLNSIRTDNPKVTIGFVPTMGALHAGHASLIEASVTKSDIIGFCNHSFKTVFECLKLLQILIKLINLL